MPPVATVARPWIQRGFHRLATMATGNHSPAVSNSASSPCQRRDAPMSFSRILSVAPLPLLCLSTIGAEFSGDEDFDAAWRPDRWVFSNGPEFPGAEGSFERSPQAAHQGEFGGRLAFDFSDGGNYVAATLHIGGCAGSGGFAALDQEAGRKQPHPSLHGPIRADSSARFLGA